MHRSESWRELGRRPADTLGSPLGEMGVSQLVSELKFQIFVVYPRLKSLECRIVGLV